MNLYQSTVGPIVLYYLHLLDQKMQFMADEKTHFAFVSRAGVRILKLYEQFKSTRQENVSQYSQSVLWTSRFLLCKVAWHSHWEVLKPIMDAEYRNKNSSDLLRGLFRHEPQYLDGVNFEVSDAVQAEAYLNAIAQKKDYTKFIQDYLAKQEALFKSYFAEMCEGRERVVLIDSGWSGTIHKLVQTIFPDKQLQSLYLGKIFSADTQRYSNNIVGLLFESEQNPRSLALLEEKPQNALALHRHIIEDLLEPRGESIEYITRDANGTIRFPQAEKLSSETLVPARDGDFMSIMSYIDQQANQPFSVVLEKYMEAIEALKNIILFPGPKEAKVFGSVERSADFGKDLMVPVLLPCKDRFEGDSVESRIQDSLWPEAQIALEFVKEPQEAKKRQLERLEPMQLLTKRTKKSNEPLVAIITRTKNRPILLERAAESVARQSLDDYVWVVVNDGGDLGPVEAVINNSVVNRKRIILISNPQSLGMEAASNLGIKESQSKYIVIHDDDDSWHPDFLKHTVAFLEGPKGKMYGGVITDSHYVSESIKGSKVIEHARYPYQDWVKQVQLIEMASGNIFAPIAFLFTRSIYDKISGFDEKLPVLGDWDFNLRFLLEADIGVVKKTLAYYHHRDQDLGTGNYSNSVTGGIDKHIEYESIVRNKILRNNLNSPASLPLASAISLGYYMKGIRDDFNQLKEQALRHRAAPIPVVQPSLSSFERKWRKFKRNPGLFLKDTKLIRLLSGKGAKRVNQFSNMKA